MPNIPLQNILKIPIPNHIEIIISQNTHETHNFVNYTSNLIETVNSARTRTLK